MKVLQVNRLVERENLGRESLESPRLGYAETSAISVLRLAVGECQNLVKLEFMREFFSQ